MSIIGGSVGCPARKPSNATSAVPDPASTPTTSFAGICSRTAATTAAPVPEVTTAAARQSLSWKARSAGGSSGFAGENTAPARSVP